MNIYIDFDHTLYNAMNITKDLLEAVSLTILEYKDINKDELDLELKGMFNREHIYNIYELSRYFGNKYDVDSKKIIENVNKVINGGAKNVFSDVFPFLKKLKENNHKIFMLSYYEYELEYQVAKIVGSKLCDFFDGIIVTKEPKYNLDIDYTNGIFIDDKPSDLEGLASRNPIRVIRIRRKEGRYSDKKVNSEKVEEYEKLSEIEI